MSVLKGHFKYTVFCLTGFTFRSGAPFFVRVGLRWLYYRLPPPSPVGFHEVWFDSWQTCADNTSSVLNESPHVCFDICRACAEDQCSWAPTSDHMKNKVQKWLKVLSVLTYFWRGLVRAKTTNFTFFLETLSLREVCQKFAWCSFHWPNITVSMIFAHI